MRSMQDAEIGDKDHSTGGEIPKTSVITLKPAIRYQFKTGQRDWPKT